MDEPFPFLDDFHSWFTDILCNTTPPTIFHYFNTPEGDPFNTLASHLQDVFPLIASATQSHSLSLDRVITNNCVLFCQF